jgi:hypothetical protein
MSIPHKKLFSFVVVSRINLQDPGLFNHADIVAQRTANEATCPEYCRQGFPVIKAAILSNGGWVDLS